MLRDQLSQRGYLRPLLWGQIKAVYELSGGDYFLWFRGIHVLQVAALIALCVHMMRPRDALGAALVPLSLAVVVGAHTFMPMVREAFPINSFLTIAITLRGGAGHSRSVRSRVGTPMRSPLSLLGWLDPDRRVRRAGVGGVGDGVSGRACAASHGTPSSR